MPWAAILTSHWVLRAGEQFPPESSKATNLGFVVPSTRLNSESLSAWEVWQMLSIRTHLLTNEGAYRQEVVTKMIFLHPFLAFIARRLAASLCQARSSSEATISWVSSLIPQFHQQKVTYFFLSLLSFLLLKKTLISPQRSAEHGNKTAFFGADKLLGERNLFDPAAPCSMHI